MNFLTHTTRVGVIACALLLSSCDFAQVKSSTDDLAKSGDAVVTAGKDADAKLQQAAYENVAARLNGNDGTTCKLFRGAVNKPASMFVRYAADGPSTELETLGKNWPDTHADTNVSCARLYTCEAHPDDRQCNTTCYTESESVCLELLKQHVAEDLIRVKRGPDGTATDPRYADQNEGTLESRLQHIELAPRTRPANLRLMFIVAGLHAYISELTAVVDKKPDDVQPIHDNFTGWEASLWDAYSAVIPNPPAGATNAQKTITTTGTAIDGLVNSVAMIVQEQKSRDQIAKSVTDNNIPFTAAIKDGRAQVEAMAKELTSYKRTRWHRVAEDYESQFNNTKDTARRIQIRQAYNKDLHTYETDIGAIADMQASYVKLFDTLDASRVSLHKLIVDPSSDQQRASLAAALKNFTTIAQKIVALYALLS